MDLVLKHKYIKEKKTRISLWQHLRFVMVLKKKPRQTFATKDVQSCRHLHFKYIHGLLIIYAKYTATLNNISKISQIAQPKREMKLKLARVQTLLTNIYVQSYIS